MMTQSGWQSQILTDSFGQAQLRVHAQCRKLQDDVQFQFRWSDPAKEMRTLEVGAQRPLSRADLIWQGTCAEVFWGEVGSESYFELNANHLRQWNIYRFTNYRQPQPPQASAVFHVQEIQIIDTEISIVVRGPWQKSSWELGFASVVVTPDQKLLYFSESKAPGKPDFHWRGLRTLKLQKD